MDRLKALLDSRISGGRVYQSRLSLFSYRGLFAASLAMLAFSGYFFVSEFNESVFNFQSKLGFATLSFAALCAAMFFVLYNNRIVRSVTYNRKSASITITPFSLWRPRVVSAPLHGVGNVRPWKMALTAFDFQPNQSMLVALEANKLAEYEGVHELFEELIKGNPVELDRLAKRVNKYEKYRNKA